MIAAGVILTAEVSAGWLFGDHISQALADEPDIKPKPPNEGRLLVWRNTKFVFVTPNGKEVGELPGHPDKLIMTNPVLSPDGKRVAFIAHDDSDENVVRHVFVRDTDGKGNGFKVAINALNVAWTPDGKALLAAEFVEAKELKDARFDNWLVNVGTKEKTHLDLPRLVQAFGMTPDGKSFVAAVCDIDARKIHLVLVSRDGKDINKLCEIRNEGPDPKLSPDGTQILFKDFDPADKPEKDVPRLPGYSSSIYRRKNVSDWQIAPLNGQIFGYCWSPNGKQICYTWKRVDPGVPLAANTDNENNPKINTETESHLVVTDADGKNAKTLISEKANRSTTITIGTVDWR